jgi:FAD:protein FMN transferase
MTLAADRPNPTPRIPNRAALLRLVGLAVLVALIAWRFLWSGNGPVVYDFTGATMGTTYAVKIETVPLSTERQDEIASIIQSALDGVDGRMSTYDTASELSRFNTHRSTAPFPVSQSVYEVFALAKKISEITGGAFDITVGPLVNAWGFGPIATSGSMPDANVVARLRAYVGWDKIVLDGDARTLTKVHPETVADLSAIAKGYAVDRVADELVAEGISTFLVEVGGELKARGAKHTDDPWRVAIEEPDTAARRVFRAVELEDAAIATSGDYRNFEERDGVMYSHIIDPRTGRPNPYRGLLVSVIDRSAAVADAWATALVVLGTEDGQELAEREGIAAFFVTRTDTGYDSWATTAFQKQIRPRWRSRR